jgi:DNA-directed RNA polymerase subunit E'/Rpb7
MLVHSFFNAMVSSDHMVSAGYVFDRELQQWIHESSSNVIDIEDKVDFVIEKIHECEGIISMEGSHPSVC